MDKVEHGHVERRGSVGADVDEAVLSKTVSDGTATHHASNVSFDTNTFYGKLQRLAGKFKVEQRGIERVPEDERNDTSYWNIGTMWLAANLVVPSFTIGVLGQPLYNIGFVDGALVIIFFNLLGSATVCFFSTFGPKFGLRQMVLSRFWFGWWGVKLIAVFNLLAGIGWSAANIIVGAQLLHAVDPSVPGWAGILIIAFCTLIIVFFGYKLVHMYEYWSWIPTFVVFMIVLGIFAHSGNFVNTPMGSGKTEIGKVLSYGSTVFGFGTGYTSLAADYTVYQPSNRPRRSVFLATWLGILPTLLFTEILGAAVATSLTINGGDNPFQQGWNQAGVGGLLGAVLFPSVGAFGRFCLVILALSIVANNCPNIYSVSLTLMVLGRWTRRVPRFIWTIVCSAVYVGIAIPGYCSFEAVLENFMHFIGYWLAIYEGIALTDHFVFKRGFSAYNPEHWDDKDKLPPGYAAVTSSLIGIVGMVMGMKQTWWVGPAGKGAGGDLGFELGFAFSASSYFVLRTIEIRILKR
ncbi:Purine-cytosine permease fcy21 [Conoideocrella luteorostrata]|uniref:Purine-cytosine permease fcy21 n=1 Tax=Conoideocrella luteorostrata TaxID=1105319 RepID=A0AAJ0CGG5_9HYPO|nr:Purine-cytosine permease fcy21 [Conoideocrella luteorostrata]